MENTQEKPKKKKKRKIILIIMLILILSIVSCNIIPIKIKYIGIDANTNYVLCEVINHKISSETIKAEDFTLIYNNKIYTATHVGIYNSRYMNFEINVSGTKTKILVSFKTEILNLSNKIIYYKNKKIN